jgi:hypothetical protein
VQVTQTKIFRVWLGPAVIVVCLLFLQFSFRWTAWALFLLLDAADLCGLRGYGFLARGCHAKKLSWPASIRAAYFGYAD